MSNPKKRGRSDSDPKSKKKMRTIDFQTLGNGPTTVKRQSTISNSVPVENLTGRRFSEGIEALSSGGNQAISTNIGIKVSYNTTTYKRVAIKNKGTEKNKTKLVRDGTRLGLRKTHTISNTISVYTHNTGLTQGMMQGGGTSYDHILPENLSLKRAQLEGRVIKQLSPSFDGDDAYDINAKGRFSLVGMDEAETNKTNPFALKDNFPGGAIAFASFLEDVTARRGLGVEGVGSAMRAQIMARKWEMKNSGTDQSSNFKQDMYDNFPQLLNATSTPKKGGVALMARNWKKKTVDNSVISFNQQTQNISNSENQALTAARQRFDYKFANDRSGKWWQKNSGDIKDAVSKYHDGNPTPLTTIRNDYIKRKMVRHGIRFSED